MKRLILTTLFLLTFVSEASAQQPTRRVIYGSSLPATCNPDRGDIYFKTGVSPREVYFCSATNTWTKFASGGGVTNGDSHDHVGGDGAAIAEGALSFSDVTTANATASAHGLLPKLSGSLYDALRGDGSWARGAQPLDVQYAANQNTGAGETTIYTKTLPAGLLSAGKTLRVKFWGTHAANANSVTIRAYFGATVVLAKPTGSSGGRWFGEYELIATGAATQTAMGNFWTNTGANATINANGIDVTSPAETLSGTVVVKLTAQGVATGDITGAGWKVILEN